jgi:ABC-2 type transport system permease protein
MSALQTQIRREFWEHRALWVAPFSIAIVLLLAVWVFGHVEVDLSDLQPRKDPAIAPSLYQLILLGWALPFYLAMAIVAASYLLDCLYGERRDRSILFWRSMPVSDARTVLVKLLVGLVMVPLGTFLAAAAASLLASGVMVLRHHTLSIHGLTVPMWDTLSWLQMQGIMLYGLVASLLWYAPFAAYLMLISVWARRSPYAWALIPPLLLVIFERMMFGSNYVGHLVNGGFGELLQLAFRADPQVTVAIGDTAAAHAADGGGSLHLSGALLDPMRLLGSARLWGGLLAATAMVVLVIRLRRVGDDS